MDFTPDVLARLVSDVLAAQRAARRRRYVRVALVAFALLGLALFVALVAARAWRGAGVTGAGSADYVAVVSIRGAIGEDEAASAENVTDALERAFADSGAKAVVLRIDSPGGTPVQASLIHERIVRLKKEHPDRKVVAVGEDLLASGAYMVAVAADEIVVNPSSLVGSIGVVSRGFGFTGLMSKLGVERRVATAGASKNMLDPFAPLTDVDRAKQAELLADVHAEFIALVRAGRGARLAENHPELFSGAVWSGRRALELGLVDRLGSLSTVVREEFGVRQIREYRASAPLLRELLRNFKVQVNVALPAGSAGALSLTR
jgi:protease-4